MHKIDRFVSAGLLGSAREDSSRLNNEIPIDEMNTVVVPNEKGVIKRLINKLKKNKNKNE